MTAPNDIPGLAQYWSGFVTIHERGFVDLWACPVWLVRDDGTQVCNNRYCRVVQIALLGDAFGLWLN